MRVFQQVVGEKTLFVCAVGGAHHAGQQADERIEQHQRGEFAARQHVVADADLLHAAGIDHALVHALVAAAQQVTPARPRSAAHLAWPAAARAA